MTDVVPPIRRQMRRQMRRRLVIDDHLEIHEVCLFSIYMIYYLLFQRIMYMSMQNYSDTLLTVDDRRIIDKQILNRNSIELLNTKHPSYSKFNRIIKCLYFTFRNRK